MLERHSQLKTWQIKKILMDSAKALDSEKDPNIVGKGLVDVVKALEMVGKPLSEQVICTSGCQERRLLDQLNVSVRNTGEKTMQDVKASLVSNDNCLKISSAEKDYGNLRVSKDASCDFEIEVAPNTNSSQYHLTLNVSFCTPTGEKKTQSHQLTYQVPNLPPSIVTQGT